MNHKFIETWSDFILNETLWTHDIDLTIRNIRNELSMIRLDFDIQKNINNSISLKLNGFRYMRDINSCLDILNNLFIDRHGWFPSKMNIKNFSGMCNLFPYNEEILRDSTKNIYYQDVEIVYESKYDIEENMNSDKLYHLSIQEYKKNILKNGIVPKSKSKLSKHLDRIYLCRDIGGCYNLINSMRQLYREVKLNRRSKLNDKWIIYEIDTNELDIKLFKDPNYEGGYYIVDNISPSIIRIIDEET